METTSGRNLTPSHRLRDHTINVNGDYSAIESNEPDDGDISNSRCRRECRIANQQAVRTDVVAPDLLNHISSESQSLREHQQACHRLLETRHADQLSLLPGGGHNGHHHPKTPWQPFYLRRTTSLLFMGVFVLMIVGLETLSTISTQQSGLPGGMPFMRYMWSYGTTGILTLTAAFWHRLDYETKVAVPWFKANPIITSKAALEVDYIDTWSLLVPFKAFRNRDWDVTSSSSISLLLQVVIVLSTALFSLMPTNLTNDAEPIFLTSRFVDDPTRLKNSESLLPYYIVMGSEAPDGRLSDNGALRNARLTYPEGCTDQFAYQTFDPVSSNLIEVKATVEGLSLDLACEPASVEKVVIMPEYFLTFQEDNTIYITGEGPYFPVTYQGCQTNISWDNFDPERKANTTFRENGMMLNGIRGFGGMQCNSTNKHDHRLVLLSFEVELHSTKQNIVIKNDSDMGAGKEGYNITVDATVSQAVALACKPSLEQISLNVSRNSEGVQSVAPINGEPVDSLRFVHPWDFIDFFFDKYAISTSAYDVSEVNMTIGANGWSQIVLAFCGRSCNQTPRLLNGTFLEEILASFFSYFAAATAHALLRERAQITSTGISSVNMTSLRVQPMVCEAMVALLTVVILTILVTQFKHERIMPCMISPGSIAAMAILAGRTASSGFSTDLGSVRTTQLLAWLSTSLCENFFPYQLVVPAWTKMNTHLSNLKRTAENERPTSSDNDKFKHPGPLRPLNRLAFTVATTGCAITLMGLLRKSANEEGLGDAEGSKYLLYLWTAVPAAILTTLSWWMSSIDTQVRLFAPYNCLKHDNCRSSILHMDLMRGLIPTILYQELKTSNFAAVLTTISALLGATLTTASAALFHVIIHPVSEPVELTLQTILTAPTPKPVAVTDSWSLALRNPSYVDTTRPSSLILETNLSYSQEVYQDLVFPTYSIITLDTANASQTNNVSSATIKAITPALRPRLSCRLYNEADIEAVYKRDQPKVWSDDLLNSISVNITSEYSCWQHHPLIKSTALFETGNLSELFFAATASNTASTILMSGCRSFLYIWGYHDSSPGPVG
ncbi:hypothetical protein PFICI_12878 [Pestalotiopsis fici W106-1]|uniref:Uncharacterized protein n=1 Tax=Pestalotiopsis fici (strain W106-1 / CGMCC3.15140) TaxID=1229662 RepID=W3WQ51_PESFW|nr:uncharacterized protein PFICI_12878 [Pestalotiopsis fici W106-1]ETS75934.1 hypothetical protein PFICI_12878 [Pestalotiopsis fici W106-1]